eukprot:jgi/Mesvir1/1288/Mv03756-RA.1
MDDFPGSIGVSKEPGGRWEAYLYASRRKIFLGNFDAKHDAASAHDYAALNYHSHEKVATNLVPKVAYSHELSFVRGLEFGILAAMLRVCAKLLRYPKSSVEATSPLHPAGSHPGSTWGGSSSDDSFDDSSQQTLRAIMRSSAEFAFKDQLLSKPAPLSLLVKSEVPAEGSSSSGRSSRSGTPTSGCSACSTTNASLSRAGGSKAATPSKRQLVCRTCGDPSPGVGPFLKALHMNKSVAPAAVVSLLGSQMRGRGKKLREDGKPSKGMRVDLDTNRLSSGGVGRSSEQGSSGSATFHGHIKSHKESRGQKRSFLSMRGEGTGAITPAVASRLSSPTRVELRQDVTVTCPDVDRNASSLASSRLAGCSSGTPVEGDSPAQSKGCQKLNVPMCSLVRRSPARRGLRASFCLTLNVPLWRDGQEISSAAMALPVTDGESVLSCLLREQTACLPSSSAGEHERSAFEAVRRPCPPESNIGGGMDAGMDSCSPTAVLSPGSSFRPWHMTSGDSDTAASVLSAAVRACLRPKVCEPVPYKRMGSAFSAWIPRVSQDRVVVEDMGLMAGCIGGPLKGGFDARLTRASQQEIY